MHTKMCLTVNIFLKTFIKIGCIHLCIQCVNKCDIAFYLMVTWHLLALILNQNLSKIYETKYDKLGTCVSANSDIVICQWHKYVALVFLQGDLKRL